MIRELALDTAYSALGYHEPSAMITTILGQKQECDVLGMKTNASMAVTNASKAQKGIHEANIECRHRA